MPGSGSNWRLTHGFFRPPALSQRRYRASLPISTVVAESAANEVVAKRMNKSQQMRWNRYTARAVLDGPGSCA
jgi:hypothetical protein